MQGLQNFFYYLIKSILLLIGLIPRRFSFYVSSVMGELFFLIDGRHRRVALDNLTHAYGHEKSPEEIKRLAKNVFKHLSQVLLEMGWSLWMDSRQLGKYISVEGLYNLKSAHEKGKGILILSAHMGHWEMFPHSFGAAGVPLNIVFRPLDFPPANRFIVEYRTRFGAKMVERSRSMRKILTLLKKNEAIGILLDQSIRMQAGVFADFFGRRAITNKGLALLAMKTGAPVVPAFMVREGMRFKAVFKEALPVIDTGDKIGDVEQNTQQYNRVLEEFFRLYPEQWFWVHRRWKVKTYSEWPKKD